MGCGASSSKVQHGPARCLEETYMTLCQIDSLAETPLLFVLHRDTRQKAIVKVISRKEGKEDAFNQDGTSREAEILKKLRHPHCVSLATVLDEGDCVHLVLALQGWHDLASLISTKDRFLENDAAFVTAQLASALNYMHSNGVCHRGLSPRSICVVSREFQSPNYLMVIISDFEDSTSHTQGYNETMGQGVDTNAFSAPELVKASVEGKTLYSCKVDIWSLGMVLYTMLCGNNPFHGCPPDVMQEKIMAAELPFKEGPSKEVWQSVSSDCFDFARRCTRLNSSLRPSALACKIENWLKVARRNRSSASSWRTSSSAATSIRNSSLSSMATRKADNDGESAMDLGWDATVGPRRSLEKRTNHTHHGGDTPPSRNSSARSTPSAAVPGMEERTVSDRTAGLGPDQAGENIVSDRRVLRKPSESSAGGWMGAKGGHAPFEIEEAESSSVVDFAKEQRRRGDQVMQIGELEPFEKLASDGHPGGGGGGMWSGANTARVENSEAEQAGAEFRDPVGMEGGRD